MGFSSLPSIYRYLPPIIRLYSSLSLLKLNTNFQSYFHTISSDFLSLSPTNRTIISNSSFHYLILLFHQLSPCSPLATEFDCKVPWFCCLFSPVPPLIVALSLSILCFHLSSFPVKWPNSPANLTLNCFSYHPYYWRILFPFKELLSSAYYLLWSINILAW